MNILFLARSLGQGGAERQLVLLSKGLRQRGHAVSVVVFYGGNTVENDLLSAGVSVTQLGKGGRWDITSFLWALARAVKRIRPDVLHAYLGVPNVLAVVLKPLIPCARVVLGVRASSIDWGAYDWAVRWMYRAECLLARLSDLIIANSQSGLDYAAENGFPRKKMVVVPNGIDVEHFKPSHEARMRVRAQWGVGDKEILIGLVGRIDPMKDHATFLRAAFRIRKEKAGMRFVCVGDGPDPYKGSMRLLASNLQLDDVLIWAGARDDVAAVYNAVDVACSSSAFGEGFSNVIGEAMACGTPCVVTNVGDSAQIVGELGRVVPPQDPNALASALLATAEEIVSENDVAAHARRERIVSEFSTARLIDRTESILQALVDIPRR